MKTHNRGITLIEILVSLVILAVVGTMVSVVFLAQNRSWRTESDKASVAMMAKGVIDELSHAVRMVGGGLPMNTAGIRVQGPDFVTFVTNETGWVDTVLGSDYVPDQGVLRIAIDSAKNFPDQGNVQLTLVVPPSVVAPGNHGAVVSQTWTLGILGRVWNNGSCGTDPDSLILDAAPLIANTWDKPGDVYALANALVYRVDSLTYRKFLDTLFIHRNQQREIAYAVGVEALNITYRLKGSANWIAVLPPASAIDQVKIRLVTRSTTVDSKLREQDSASRGYHYSTLETEVTLRNDKLVNR